MILSGVALVTGQVALPACIAPAVRATRIDPADVLTDQFSRDRPLHTAGQRGSNGITAATSSLLAASRLTTTSSFRVVRAITMPAQKMAQLTGSCHHERYLTGC